MLVLRFCSNEGLTPCYMDADQHLVLKRTSFPLYILPTMHMFCVYGLATQSRYTVMHVFSFSLRILSRTHGSLSDLSKLQQEEKMRPKTEPQRREQDDTEVVWEQDTEGSSREGGKWTVVVVVVVVVVENCSFCLKIHSLNCKQSGVHELKIFCDSCSH